MGNEQDSDDRIVDGAVERALEWDCPECGETNFQPIIGHFCGQTDRKCGYCNEPFMVRAELPSEGLIEDVVRAALATADNNQNLRLAILNKFRDHGLTSSS
jgi:transposase-like protein